MFRKRIKFVRQHDHTDCGPACLSAIMQFYGKTIPLAKVRRLVKTDQYGTNIYGIIDGAKKCGMQAVAFDGTFDDFIKEASSGIIKFPIIARVYNNENYEHYVVIIRVGKREIEVMDPAIGHCKISYEGFRKSFFGQIITFKITDAFIKRNEVKSIFFTYFTMALKQKKWVFLVVSLSVILTLIGIVPPLLYQYLLDVVLPAANDPDSIQEFALLIIAAGLLYFISFALQLIRGKVTAGISKRINTQLMLGYYDKAVDMPIEQYGLYKTGDLMSRFSDNSLIQEAITTIALTLFIDIAMTIFGGVILYRQSRRLFFVAVIIMLLNICITIGFSRPLAKKKRSLLKKGAELNSYLKESFDGIVTVKSLQAEADVKGKAHHIFSNLQNVAVESTMIGLWRNSLSGLISSLGSLYILWMGCIEISRQNLTVGSMISFFALMSFFFDPVENLLQLQPTLQSAFAASERLQDVLDADKESMSNSTEKINTYSVEFVKVSFRYGNRNEILHNISFVVEDGKYTALVGRSGCGKTTILKLIMRYYQPINGKILVGNSEIENISDTELRRKIAYVLQEAFFFSSSILDNLLLGNNAPVSLETINHVLDLCGCAFVYKMPMGIYSPIEENAANFSGGQKQRLSIARALLREPDILLLDEATSNLDVIAEHELLRNLRKEYPNMTVIIVAHHMDAIKICDNIILLEDGFIKNIGTHSSLIKSDPLFQELCSKQVNS